jgi:hypothetical protein
METWVQGDVALTGPTKYQWVEFTIGDALNEHILQSDSAYLNIYKRNC